MAIPPEVTAAATEVGKAAVLALAAYIANGVRGIKAHIATTDQRLTRVEHTLFGVDGDNGLKSVTRDTDRRVDDLERTVDRMGGAR
jgi:hypothetical protein